MAISLLPHDTAKAQSPALRRLLNIGAALLAGYLVVMAVVGGIFLYVNGQQQNLVKKHEDLIAELKTYQDKEEKLFLLKDRVSTLANLPQALNFRQVLDLLPDLIGQNLTVDGISLVGGQVKLVVAAGDTFELEELVNNINKSSNLTEATLENLDLDTTGEFLATLSLKVKK